MTPRALALIFGGPSAEHDISLVSARCILAALDRSRFAPVLLGIARDGQWYLVEESLLQQTGFDAPVDVAAGTPVFLLREGGAVKVVDQASRRDLQAIDVAFPIVHGPGGEDGALQGMLRLLNLPFVGCDVAASAAGMDKEFTKRLLMSAGIPVSDFLVFKRGADLAQAWEQVAARFAMPVYVKPANMGSSVGVHKVDGREAFLAAAADALRYDSKFLVEENIVGDEVEVAVLGNLQAQASVPGAFHANDAFYTFDAKYMNANGASFRVPATADDALNQRLRELALEVYRVLDCRGLTRVDSFLTPDGRVLVNEVNTLPGFTPISMYPALWEATGLPYGELVSRLVELAFEAHGERAGLALNR